MAVSTIPKSEFRRSKNIIVGHAVVPAVEIEGVQGWGLPGGEVTFSEKTARNYAKQLDKEIRSRTKDLRQLSMSNAMLAIC